ncbi:MAG: TolC family protein [Bacteroidales bacterium]|jgi:outer membrane protein TolC
MKSKRINIIAYLLIILLPIFATGQNTHQFPLPGVNDSLTLQQILQQVTTSYPTVLTAQEAIISADAAIGLAKSGYYPDISGQAGYTRLGPASKLSIPMLGSFELYPQNNYNVEVDARETIYDFSKTSRKVKMEESQKSISEKSVELVKQKLNLVTVASYYSLVYLQEALKINEVQLQNLNDHLAFVTKKKETGSAIQYEILATQVRISSAENQKVDIQTGIMTQQAILNSLLGFPVSTPLKVKKVLTTGTSDFDTESLVRFALQNRYEMVVAGLQEDKAGLNLRLIKAQNYPELDAFINGSIKNGFFPNINVLTPNYVAGVGLRVPIFDATHRKNNIRLANAEINVVKQETEQTRRDISTEVYQNEALVTSSLQKIRQSDMQVKQSEEALHLAKVSYSTGAITNLDLLDAETAAAESKVNLLKAQTDYAVSMARLNISLGKPVY